MQHAGLPLLKSLNGSRADEILVEGESEN